MRYTMTTFFLTRLVLYMLAFAAPVIHPAVVVPYDRLGWWLWFGVLPLEMVIAFALVPPRVSVRTAALAVALPAAVAIVVAASGIFETLIVLGVVLFATVSTWFIFHTEAYSRVVATFEPFLLVVLYYRLLRFSRASEEIAAAAGPLPQTLLVLIPLTFLVHTLTVYLVLYREPGNRSPRRELAVFGTVALTVVILAALVLPHDYVSHSPITNLLRDDHDYERQSLDQELEGLDELGPESRDEEGALHGGLEGVPSDQWGENGGENGEPDKQYAVMVVASDSGPVYAADAYYSQMHPRDGFHEARDKELNELSNLRLLETWRSRSTDYTRDRTDNETFFLSSRSERYLQYSPTRITPTTLDRRYHPFNYAYSAEASALTRGVGNAHDWSGVSFPDAEQAEELEKYLEVPLSEEDRAVFERHLEQHLGSEILEEQQDGTVAAGRSNPSPSGSGLAYHERVTKILHSFSEFQYEAGYDDDVSIGHMVRFLESDRTGDCVEFSHTTAILARMAGIPSRVVTGYIAAEELQTPSHQRGLASLRERIKPLQDYDLNELYLVTTAHRHAWVQLYLPEHGWVEFETTSYAIPPVGHGDPNQRDVVIPMLQDEPVGAPSPSIPWELVARAAALLVAAAAAGAFGYRHLRELYLTRMAKRPTEQGAEALYRLLLLRSAAHGAALKPRSETAREFAERVPEATEFAQLYTQLRYRTRWSAAEREATHAELRALYYETLRRTRRPGLLSRLRTIFSLRGLRYQW